MNLQSNLHIPERRTTKVIQEVANTVFGQDWIIEKGLEQDFSNVLPSRQTLKSYVEDYTILTLQKFGEEIVNNSLSGGVNTIQFDDTVKKSGNKSFDVKTVLITAGCDDESGKTTKRTFSLGYEENLSHKGKDGAETITSMLKRVAVLIGVSYEEFLDLMDFSMSDRGGDVDSVLDELGGFDRSERMKCNAHILLSVDSSLSKTFKTFEIKAGATKLLGQGLEATFSLTSNDSIWILGLIAFAKLLSPSHAQDTLSLSKSYNEFIKQSTDIRAEDLIKNGFKKFQSNRFGRQVQLSKLFVMHRPLILKFFEDTVDESDNRLFLASFCYLNSDWFFTCCKIASRFSDSFVEPLMEILGIDQYHDKPSTDYPRTWLGLKYFFKDKLAELKEMQELEDGKLAYSKVFKYALTNVVLGIERQLSCVDFFNDDGIEHELKHVPLTNSKCESNFGKLDYTLSQTSGAYVNLNSVSNKNIISSGSSLKSENLTAAEKKAALVWARRSQESQEYKNLVKEYKDKVTHFDSLAIESRKEKKKLKTAKMYKALENVNAHGGPVTPANLDLLDKLNQQQLVLEIRYLRASVAPNIRERFKLPSGKFQSLSPEDLKMQILNVLKPAVSKCQNLDAVFQDLQECFIFVFYTRCLK